MTERETAGKPPWTQRELFGQLVARGVIDETGVNDKPRLKHCAGCGLLVWAAWENGYLDTVLADDITLTPLGEYQALMAGRRTFDHWGGSAGLDLRRPRAIRSHPATNDFSHRIRPEHRCGDPHPDHYPRPRHETDPEAPPPF